MELKFLPQNYPRIKQKVTMFWNPSLTDFRMAAIMIGRYRPEAPPPPPGNRVKKQKSLPKDGVACRNVGDSQGV